ncbi:MAG: hypothetical protein K2O27_08820 [Candidatus Amulumruptor sp.]|nr:hypothetical protein [Candidatus Amulumruptor sp.]
MTTASTRTLPLYERLLNGAAGFFSFIFSPLLAPTYGIVIVWLTTILMLLPGGTVRSLLLTVFSLTCLVPLLLIGLLWKLGIVSDPGLNKRSERTWPFAISATGYAVVIFLMIHVNAPSWITMFISGGLVATIVAAIVNLRWKISIHLTGMGGLLGLMCRLYASHLVLFNGFAVMSAIIVATGLVGTSRLILNRHTPLQVVAGIANGFICVFMLTAIKW